MAERENWMCGTCGRTLRLPLDWHVRQRRIAAHIAGHNPMPGPTGDGS